MTAREAVEDVVRVARENNVYINDAAIPRSIAKMDGNPPLIAAFYESGMRLANGEAILVDFYA
jgi:hypothetical protein